MGLLCVVLILSVAAVSAGPLMQQRIVGGTTTPISQYPTIVALLYSWDNYIFTQGCGGGILTSRSVLTAAHCPDADPTFRWRIRVGSTYANSGGVVHNVDSSAIHPNYSRATLDSDIAVMRTATTIIFMNNAVQPAMMAGPSYNLFDNEEVWAAGWGSTVDGGSPSEQLRHVQIWTINQQICRNRYGSILSENMLCSGWLDLGGRDQCQQVSGGPLYHDGVVVGVCAFGGECGSPFFPKSTCAFLDSLLGFKAMHNKY